MTTTNYPPTISEMLAVTEIRPTNTLTLMDLSEIDDSLNFPESAGLFEVTYDGVTNNYLCSKKSEGWIQISCLENGIEIGFPTYAHARQTMSWELNYNSIVMSVKANPTSSPAETIRRLSLLAIVQSLPLVENHASVKDYLRYQFGAIFNAHLAIYDGVAMATTGELPVEMTSVDYFGLTVHPFDYKDTCVLAINILQNFLQSYNNSLTDNYAEQKARKPQSKKAKHNAKRKANKANKAKQKANPKK